MNKTSSFCTPICDPFYSCTACSSAVEDAAIESAANFGIPEWYGCGYCGTRFGSKDPEAFIKHMKECHSDANP